MLDDTSKSTRDRVLQTLLRKHRCTINELAEVVEINPISVRHHIAKLQAEGLVLSEEERHGVGRPRQVFFLTEAGIERFLPLHAFSHSLARNASRNICTSDG
jgi:predicted ArsR family transcriptional regulator